MTAWGRRVVSGTALSMLCVVGAPTFDAPAAFAADSGVVSGTVTGAGSSGLAGICVTAYDADDFALSTTTTGSTGAWSISGLPAGDTRFGFDDCTSTPAAWVPRWYVGATTLDGATVVGLQAGSPRTGVDIQLARAGRAVGTVTVAGAVAADICVSVVGSDGTELGSDVTGTDGQYAVGGLPAVSVRVGFTDCGDNNAVAEWWNDKPDLASANLLPVTAGGSATANAALATGGTVRGTVRGAGGAGLGDVCITAWSTASRQVGEDLSQAGGAYELSNLPAGPVRLRLADCGGRGVPTEWYADRPSYASATALDVAAGSSQSINPVFARDTTPPDTTITGGPVAGSTITTASPSVTFTSTEPESTFTCRLDSGAWTSCTSPRTLSALSEGQHTIAVTATDFYGNADPTPDSRTFTVDTTPPDTTISSGPAATITTTSTSVSFSSSEAGATFECSLDSAAYAGCSSPKTLSGLSEGSHAFNVRAKDAAGNVDSSPATRTFIVDTTPPATTITAGPAATIRTTSTSVSFTSEAGATFECSLDGAAYAGCTSPTTLSGLTDGSHTFRVRAKDTAGNVNQTPASRTFTVDTTPPDTTITDGPAATIRTTSTSVSFTSEAGASFECSLDGAAYASCTSPTALSGLTDGSHTFNVRAKDAAGNVDLSPTARTFAVDTTPPTTTITDGPAATIKTTSTSVSFTSEAGATFACSLDSAAYVGCTSPKAFSGLTDGSHSFRVRATDTAGNVNQTPTTRTFIVDTTPPSTAITEGPAAGSTITTRDATFRFSSEVGASFECSLDSAPYAGCTSPQALTGLTNGSHTFKVRATDAAGNVNPTPTSRTFAVAVAVAVADTVPPDTAMTQGPSEGSTVESSSTSFAFSSEAGATFLCSLDGAPYTSCSSPITVSGLADGRHTFDVRARDAAGNLDPTPARRAFTVRAPVPTQPETPVVPAATSAPQPVASGVSAACTAASTAVAAATARAAAASARAATATKKVRKLRRTGALVGKVQRAKKNLKAARTTGAAAQGALTAARAGRDRAC